MGTFQALLLLIPYWVYVDSRQVQKFGEVLYLLRPSHYKDSLEDQHRDHPGFSCSFNEYHSLTCSSMDGNSFFFFAVLFFFPPNTLIHGLLVNLLLWTSNSSIPFSSLTSFALLGFFAIVLSPLSSSHSLLSDAFNVSIPTFILTASFCICPEVFILAAVAALKYGG